MGNTMSEVETNEELSGIDVAKARIAQRREELGGGDLAEEKTESIEVIKQGEDVIIIDEVKPKEPAVDVIEGKAEEVIVETEVDTETENEKKWREKFEKSTKKLNDEDGKRGVSLAQANARTAKLADELDALKKSMTSNKVVVEDTIDSAERLYNELSDDIKDKWEEKDLKAVLELQSAIGGEGKARLDKLESENVQRSKDSEQKATDSWFAEVESEVSGFIEANRSDPKWHEYLDGQIMDGVSTTRRDVLANKDTVASAGVAIYKQYLSLSDKPVKKAEKKSEKPSLADIASPRAMSTSEPKSNVVQTITTEQYERYRKQAATADGDETKIRNWKVARRLKAEGNVI